MRKRSAPYSLVPRGKRGILSVRFTTPGGRKVFRSSGTSDPALANEWASKIHAEAYRVERLGDKPARYWTEAVARWHSEHAQKRSLNKDVANLRWLDPYLRDKRLTDIDADLLAIIFAARRSEPRDKRNPKSEPTSQATVDRMAALVRSILKSAVEWEWIDRAPRIRLLASQSGDFRWLTRIEADALDQALADHLRPPYRFALATGLREQNVIRLEWSRVDLSRNTMHVIGADAKGKRAIGFPLNRDARDVLRGQLGQSDRWVFPGPEGEPYARANNTGFKAAQRRAGIAPVRWHDLRHTWASWHVMAGTSLRELMELGGWQSIQSVMRYAHLAPDHLAKAAEKVARNLHADSTARDSETTA